MHQPGLEAALLQPAHDLVIGEAEVRFDPHIWDPSALHVRIDRLASRARYGPWRASELFCEAICLD
jgi:hypothetical protein